MDILTDVFDEMYLSGQVVARFDLAAPWGIRLPPKEGIFHVIVQGDCWVRLAPDDRLVKVSAGDLIIFPEGGDHDVVDSPTSPTITLEDALSQQENESLICPLGEKDSQYTFICGVFHFRDGNYHAFRNMLPPMLHIRGSEAGPTKWLQLALMRLSEETAAIAPGSSTMISRLTDILFIEGVREWLKSESGETTGWLNALNDLVVRETLECIHGDPAQQWTVASLAAQVGFSRSAFAAHFTRLVGTPPLRYVTSWRMQLARSWLRTSNMSVAEIAERLG